MDLLGLLSITEQILGLLAALKAVVISSVVDSIFYLRCYGISGIFLVVYGNNTVWRMQFEVLAKLSNEDAIEFRKCIVTECNSTAVAGAIIAQIAITSLSLPFLSSAHWVAKAFWIFSLTSAIMTVYFANKQQRILGRLLQPAEIRRWISGKPNDALEFCIDGKDNFRLIAAQANTNNLQPVTANDLLPAVASVLITSAPHFMLSISLASFITGLGVYLGFVWKRSLDANSSANDSRDVFIVYLVGITGCYIIYILAISVQNSQEDELIYYVTIGRAIDRANGQYSEKCHQQMLRRSASNADGGQVDLSSISSPEGIQNSQLIAVLRESARLRREAAAMDEKVAQIYDDLSNNSNPPAGPSLG